MKEYIERAQLLKNLGYDETRRAGCKKVSGRSICPPRR